MKRWRKVSIVFLFWFVSAIVISSSGLTNDPSFKENSQYVLGVTPIVTSEWSNWTVISDSVTKWNVGSSFDPDVALDENGTVHVVWVDDTPGIWGTDWEIMYANYTADSGWSHPFVVSDEGANTYDGDSGEPKIAVDLLGNVHVVWHDRTDGWWGTDTEIMYRKYTPTIGWSSITVISDNSSLWNTGSSLSPSIAIDSTGRIHVVWKDGTSGWWGTDYEIMYCSYLPSTGWTNPIVISDNETLWNDDDSENPAIAIDNLSKIHVVWVDGTDGWWGTDIEIMYCSYSPSTGWNNPIVISDGDSLWNDGYCEAPEITTDESGNVYVVWCDYTDGWWGTDSEIMCASYLVNSGWTAPIIISDNTSLWNTGNSVFPDIASDENGNIYVVWEDSTPGWWGTDYEIMFANYSSETGWSSPKVISDDSSKINIGNSRDPAVATKSSTLISVVWEDFTPGWWETDEEIMYANYTSSTTQSTVESSGIPGFSLFYSLYSVILLCSLAVVLKCLKKF